MIIAQQLIAVHATAIAEVLEEWKSRWPGLGVLALLPEDEKDGVSVLQEVANDYAIPIHGAIFPSLITDTGFQRQGVWLLCFEYELHGFLIENILDQGAGKLVKAVRTSQSESLQASDRPKTLMTIFDAMVPNIASLMEEVHLQLDETYSYLGVNAGSESFRAMPCLFDNHRLLGHAVLGLLLFDVARAVVCHEYPVSKSLMWASSAKGNRIVSIDNRPAFEVYQEVILKEYGVSLNQDNFYQLAVHFPFGVVTAIDVLVRIPVKLDEDGSFYCVGEIPQESMLRLLMAPKWENSSCVASICNALSGAIAPHEPFSLLTFYCAGRRMHFQDDAIKELQQIRRDSGSQRLFGALSLGELDSLEEFNFPRFHNAAIVCLPQMGH